VNSILETISVHSADITSERERERIVVACTMPTCTATREKST